MDKDTWEGSGIRGLKKVKGQAQWEQGSSGAVRGGFTSFTLHVLNCQCLSGSLMPRPENPASKGCGLSSWNRRPFLWIGVRLPGSSPSLNSHLGQFGAAGTMGFATSLSVFVSNSNLASTKCGLWRSR